MPTDSGRPSMMDAILAGEEVRFVVGNREICFKEPVKSMINGQLFTNQRAYRDHLKQHKCVEVGDRPFESKEKLEGDFNVRGELRSAVREVLNKKYK